MGFFKDFKDDFSQALNELLPGDEFTEEDEIQVNTLDNELDVEQELSKLDGLLEQVEKKSSQTAPETVSEEPELRPLDEVEAEIMEEQETLMETQSEKMTESELEAEPEPEVRTEFEVEPEDQMEPEAGPETEDQTEHEAEPESEDQTELEAEPEAEDMAEPEAEPEAEDQVKFEAESETEPEPEITPEADEADVYAETDAQMDDELYNTQMDDIMKEEKTMDTMDTTVKTATETTAEVETATAAAAVTNSEVTDEVSVITAGTSIKGNMDTTGSFEIEGKIEGDIKCNGKLTVVGSVIGNSTSSEFFADAAHIEGEVVSSGTVKVGLGSVIIGNITATSAVIAGAVKGDIDVQGPVVVDTSAVIMGNIKSRSVQINNGAVIEGFCSQCYSDVDVESLFAKSK